ncbi:MAG: gliding motility-associated transport system ATP-binding protein, partial [Actinomycetota bacterium]|nr:gliding motility-associated transport system ATP-binding protein [Actinomycetota bacterium]
MISGEGLARSFGGHEAVRAVDIRVGDGEVVGLLGPNGAGKTTTIRMLLGLLRPSAGRVEVDRPLGYLPEQLLPDEGLTVRGYLRFCARMRRVEQREAAIEAALDAVGIGDLARRPIGRLSKGQRQRVGV